MDTLDWVGKWADYTPEKLAVSSYQKNERYTYGDLNCYANNLITTFQSLQLKEGDRVVVLAEHSAFYLVFFTACQRMGLILTPINYRLASHEIDNLLLDCEPSLIVYSKNFEKKINFNHFSKSHCYEVNEIKKIYHKASSEKQLENYTIKENNPIFLFYTSGTTGSPKGVLYTNKMLFWNSLNTSMQLGITFKDSTLNVLPPYHTSGWNIFITPLLHKGGSIVIVEKFNPETTLQLLEQLKTTLFLALPTMLTMLQESAYFKTVQLDALRYIISGGEMVKYELVSHWKTKKNIDIKSPGYGLTEAGPSITSLHHEKVLEKPNSIGKPNFYLTLKVLNAEGKETQPFEVGEICIKGDVITPAYWNNSVETQRKIKNGWFYTEDLAYTDEEGYLFIKGRKDDMYISGGENIYPQEIEAALEQVPGITKAIILPIDDSKWGKSGIAFVTTQNNLLTPDTIRASLKGNLADYKLPKHIFILDEIPHTSLGKVSRKQLYLYFNEIISEL